MKHIFILYSFSNVDVHNFLRKFGQTLCSLTLTKSYMRSKKRRKYKLVHTMTNLTSIMNNITHTKQDESTTQ